jgi:hypothetical protein
MDGIKIDEPALFVFKKEGQKTCPSFSLFCLSTALFLSYKQRHNEGKNP